MPNDLQHKDCVCGHTHDGDVCDDCDCRIFQEFIADETPSKQTTEAAPAKDPLGLSKTPVQVMPHEPGCGCSDCKGGQAGGLKAGDKAIQEDSETLVDVVETGKKLSDYAKGSQYADVAADAKEMMEAIGQDAPAILVRDQSLNRVYVDNPDIYHPAVPLEDTTSTGGMEAEAVFPPQGPHTENVQEDFTDKQASDDQFEGDGCVCECGKDRHFSGTEYCMSCGECNKYRPKVDASMDESAIASPQEDPLEGLTPQNECGPSTVEEVVKFFEESKPGTQISAGDNPDQWIFTDVGGHQRVMTSDELIGLAQGEWSMRGMNEGPVEGLAAIEASLKAEAAGLFNYEWDPGSSWSLKEVDGTKQIVESKVDETEAFQVLTNQNSWKFKEGDRVVSLEGPMLIAGTVVERKEPHIVAVKDDSTGLITSVSEQYLEPETSQQLSFQFSAPPNLF